MSMENAILEHAAALRELSAAIKAMYAGRGRALALPLDDDAETANHQCDFGADDKTSSAPDETSTKQQKDAELEKAVAKVEADAKKETADEGSPTGTVDHGDEDKVLNYEKDVRPLLLAAIKKGKRGEIEAFLAGEGVKKADELPAEKLPALFDLAQKLAA